MIFCDKHKFLLIKNMKVGSTSLEVELSQILPDSAIVTFINPPNKKHRPRNMGSFVNHTSFLEANKKLDLTDVKSYVMVRHPFNMVLSDFFFRKEIMDLGDWNKLTKVKQNDMINKYFSNDFSNGEWFKSTKNLYTIDNKIAVTKILKYENGLEDEINSILPAHGLPTIKIVTYEKEYRPKNVTYDIFSKEILDMIRKEWSWEFDSLGYNYYYEG